MLCCGFSDETRGELDRLIDEGLGGVILFSRNAGRSPEEIWRLVADLKTRASRPLYVCIDQEGGRVRRLRDGFSPIPSMRDVGATGDDDLARDVGRLLAAELRACGFDLDFAPCVDVDTNPANPVIADRSFGPDPATVSRFGAAFVQGMQEAGVAACAKHFPGHGDTALDSHTDLPRLDHDMPRLERVELLPFEAAIRAGVASVMSAHVIFTPLDAHLPATLSPDVIEPLLRRRMGFEGVIFSDDLEMAAIRDHFGVEEAIRLGLGAGIDVFTICHTPDLQWRARNAIVAAVERGDLPLERIERSVARIEALTRRYARPPGQELPERVFASPQHVELRERVFSRVPPARDRADPTEDRGAPTG